MPSKKEVIEDYKNDPVAAKAKYTLQYYLDREAATKQKMRGYYLKKKYNTSHEEYEELFTKQGGACAICGTTESKKKLAVDHDHITGKNRGLLCVRCNIGLGHFLDDRKLLESASVYLYKYLDMFVDNQS